MQVLLETEVSGLVSLDLRMHRTLKPRNERLRSFIEGWRERARATLAMVAESEPESSPDWQELLLVLGESTDPQWIIKLVDLPERRQVLEQFLADSPRESVRLVCERVKTGLLNRLDEFSLAAVTDAKAAREDFLAERTGLEELYRMVADGELGGRVEFALNKFDLQLVARKAALKARLNWKPQEIQSRVDSALVGASYDPGCPNWWSGKLNDAPEMLGSKLTLERAEQTAMAMERSLQRYLGKPNVPRPTWANVHLGNTFFSQGQEPRVQFGELKGAPGVEGYLKKVPQGGPRVLEIPMENGKFQYLMFDGHHRAAAQIIRGHRRFFQVTVMRLGDVESRFGLTRQEIVDAIRDIHTHLYMTDAPVPR